MLQIANDHTIILTPHLELEPLMKRMTAILLLVFLLTCFPAFGQDLDRTATTDVESIDGYNCLFIGHSFFIPVAQRFERLPEACGVEEHQQKTVFSGGRSGSPGELWRGGKRTEIQAILETGEIGLLGMTYYDPTNSSLEDYKRWINDALEHNPDTAFFIGLPWGLNGARRDLEEYEAAGQRANESLYRTVLELRRLYPDNTFLYAYYGMSSVELKRLYEAGDLPDVENAVGPSGLYRDGMGHASNILKDLAALVWLATLYDIDLADCDLELEYETDLMQVAEEIVAEQPDKQQQLEEATP
jgi:hypothetical protein